MEKKLFIKNMVCNRCIIFIKTKFEKLDIELKHIELGTIIFHEESEDDFKKIKAALEENGFEILLGQEEKLVEQTKITIIKLLQKLPLQLEKTLSKYLESKLNLEYSKISKIFSMNEHITIEKYFIKLKIEKAKELIQLQENNFTGISQQLDYSNVNHFSSQFKNETGMSLTSYKNEQRNYRNPLDQIV
ncbi:helix-turn-helix domain-containing protein [Tenacibaculum finnmarkense]|uniref:helix-turn-helix domain-containing protein n=1 Tax=Tenacibaculum TaxID=104267 RepID=UPI00187B4C63|nr:MULTISPECIES: AraC family transcriptional regulator [Tenacibaculum]MCD8425933.1 AraC family transcriptional regulator [Tenacibaculum dicentrarchi]MBE7688976.1 helix-turn-helix domain-containing protein [Tenacibaculum finnmarkense genomovar ulcerans]MBE7693613.1 helix-turn-helix domain-containing protein [Tenacibaculum finnmarkense genomovar finnmarkense]MCD8410990.1 AraC family transcriptional regulator [Tenacibaculum finnmarkense genomovar ulcerans]MCG8184419.1 helix-turn-helix domain-cont